MMWDRRLIVSLVVFLAACIPAHLWAQEVLERALFRVKYVAEGAVYLEGGRAAGLKEGQELIVEHFVAPAAPVPNAPNPPAPSGIIATLRVLSLTASSAVCEVVSSTELVQVGDMARFTAETVQGEREQQQHQRLVGGREFPQIITFSGADPIIEEARAEVPRPPSPEINRMRGRIGFEYSSILSHNNPSSRSSEVGAVARFEMTRIFGTYWNFNGFWRGRFSTLSGPAAPATVSDLINRTYTLSLQYNNPSSPLVAGGGRLYLPWATSLDVMDGGYVGRRVGEHVTLGVFGGTTPDPTSYDYNPSGKLAGTFINFSGGSWETTRYSTTFGLALSAIHWHANRQFFFSETSIAFANKFSIYDAMEVDATHVAVTDPTTTPPTTASTGGLNRSYFTVRYQASPRVELNVTDTYFRDFPTFDPQLIGTGLLDRYLFQGLSGGARVNVTKGISLYSDIGKSSRSGDTKNSWNQLYGVTFNEIWKTGIRADLRYSKFNSSFGSGDYKAISLSRSFRETLQWQLQAGFQNFNSTLTTTSQTHFVTSYLDWSPGKKMFFEAGYTWQRGGTMNYDQFQFMIGKRF